MKTAIFVFLTTVALLILYRMVKYYYLAEGSVWDRLLATAKYSATVLWSMIVALGASILAGISYLAEALNLPDVKAWVTMLPAEWVGFVVAAIMGLTVVSRLRSLPNQPNPGQGA
ncbi:hypothetical protein [Bradyrhizobium sp. Leo121]|uniref:hypothetical protein n=1 Tax=Bradyrhizobium sp. Leo121 TaxID=1571195 RepID=UPI00102A7B91|nr:hypothetical protein [Bradyrhizobium sp. Leo121]RZN13906.1 hypothetical protein CWO90_43955 [Bradyrhizobium sp. Leo121]